MAEGWHRRPAARYLLTNPVGHAGVCLCFKNVWFMIHQTEPYVNLAGRGLGGAPFTLVAAYTRSSVWWAE